MRRVPELSAHKMLLLQLESNPNGRKFQQIPRLRILAQNAALKNNARPFLPGVGENCHRQQHPLCTAQSLPVPVLAPPGHSSARLLLLSPDPSDCHNPAVTPCPARPCSPVPLWVLTVPRLLLCTPVLALQLSQGKWGEKKANGEGRWGGGSWLRASGGLWVV